MRPLAARLSGSPVRCICFVRSYPMLYYARIGLSEPLQSLSRSWMYVLSSEGRKGFYWGLFSIYAQFMDSKIGLIFLGRKSVKKAFMVTQSLKTSKPFNSLIGNPLLKSFHDWGFFRLY